MTTAKGWLGNWWVVVTLAAMIAIVVLCVGLPYVAPSTRAWRWWLLALVVLAWSLAATWRIARSRRAAAALATAVAGKTEAGQVGKRLGDALAQVKAARGTRRDYLYARPWYVMIGPPRAGKTTALKASGLRFAAVDQVLKGVGGTRNLDFWFADEAVLVDTAGRYTTQDSDSQEDAAGWRAFLETLRRHRPRQPINGVVVAMPLDQVASVDRQTLDAHAAAIRRRIAELSDLLQVEVPVYLLFTKADLLAGFAEYFDDLDVEGRRAVVGRTFAMPDAAHDATQGAAQGTHGTPVDADTLAAAFDEVTQAVADRQAKRLSDEPDVARRSLILGFPTQVADLRARVVRFIDGAFTAGERDAPGARLRGFYLASGTQAGTPIDRLLGGMAEAYQAPASQAQGPGRAYFLNRLIGEVILPEAGLGALRAGATRREQVRASGVLIGIAAIAAIVILAWTVSFVRNRGEQSTLLAAAMTADRTIRDHHVDLVQVNAADAPIEEAVAVLDALRDLPGGAAARAGGFPPLDQRFGLWQRGLSDEAVAIYEAGLRRILMPRLLLRMEDALHAAAGDPARAYDPLKAYLALGGERPGGIDAAALRRWIVHDWATTSLAGPDRAALRDRLAGHLDAMLAAGGLERVWADTKVPLDAPLVGQARAGVQSLSPGQRAYAALRQGAAGPDWTPARTVNSTAYAAFADPARVRGLTVPWFFTRNGYTRYYRIQLPAVADALRRDAWVLGPDAVTSSTQTALADMMPQIATAYAADYNAQWDRVTATLVPGDLWHDAAAFAAFTNDPSPFKQMLLAVRIQTSLGDPAGADAGSRIAQHFQATSDYVGDGKAPGHVDQFVAAVKQRHAAVQAAGQDGARTGAGGSAGLGDAMSTAGAGLSDAAAYAPPELKGAMDAVITGSAAAQVSVVRSITNSNYAGSVLPGCKAATENLYPFYATAGADVPAPAIQQTFGPGGTMPALVQGLRAILDGSGPVWHWRTDNPAAAAFDPSSADMLTRTAPIGALLAYGQAFSVALKEVGPAVDAVEISQGGATVRLDAASIGQPRQMKWNLNDAPEARVVLLKGGQRVDGLDRTGSWALFHLFDAAQQKNDGRAMLLAFGVGDRSATLRIEIAGDQNPFKHGGLWAFRCPAAL